MNAPTLVGLIDEDEGVLVERVRIVQEAVKRRHACDVPEGPP
jgi:hypothetical protein